MMSFQDSHDAGETKGEDLEIHILSAGLPGGLPKLGKLEVYKT